MSFRTRAILIAVMVALAFPARAHGGPVERKALMFRGRVADVDGAPISSARVLIVGGVSIGVDSAGRYALRVPLGTLDDLARRPLELRLRARSRGYRIALATGATELAIELSVVAREDTADILVRSSDSRVAAAVSQAFVHGGEAVELGGIYFVGAHGVEGEAAAAPLSATEHAALSGVAAPHVRAATSQPSVAPERGAEERLVKAMERARRDSLARVSAVVERARRDSLARVSAAVERARRDSLARVSAVVERTRRDSLAKVSAVLGQSRRDSLRRKNPTQAERESLFWAERARSRAHRDSIFRLAREADARRDSLARIAASRAQAHRDSLAGLARALRQARRDSLAALALAQAAARDSATAQSLRPARPPSPAVQSPQAAAHSTATPGIPTATSAPVPLHLPEHSAIKPMTYVPLGSAPAESARDDGRKSAAVVVPIPKSASPPVHIDVGPPTPSRSSKPAPAQTRALAAAPPPPLDSCACLIRGTVEVEWDRPLEERLSIVISLEDQPAARDTVELFMGSPREFHLPRVTCGRHVMRVEPRSRRRYLLSGGESSVEVRCASGGARQLRLVLEPGGR